jgi:hypothetical protein
MSHPLHKVIGKIIEKNVPSGYELAIDRACGGEQNIPLFSSKKKSNQTEYCNVDLLILKKDKIKVLIEIEEADTKPTQICGKYLTSALSSYYIHKSKDDIPISMDDSVLFVQILDTENLVKEKTQKPNKWTNIERSIRGIIPIKGSKIEEYKIFSGDKSEFCGEMGNKLIAFIKNYLYKDFE